MSPLVSWISLWIQLGCSRGFLTWWKWF